MREIIKQVCSDEQGQISAPRVQSMMCTITGILTIIAGFIFLACGIEGTAPYVSLALGFAFGKGSTDIWAAQLKSGKVLAAQATSTTTTTATTATATIAPTSPPLTTPPTTPGAPS